MDQQQINETDISSLPPEMIVKIFEFLTFRERLTASRTCKQWHQLAFNPRKMRIRFNDRKLQSLSLLDIGNFYKYRNACVNLETICENYHKYVIDFITTVPLESLEIYSERKSMQKILAEHLPRMSALSKLCIGVTDRQRHCEDGLRINHPTLKSVSIGGQTDRESFEINCPNLTDLEIYLNDENSMQVVTQLQHQLQSLHLIFFQSQDSQALENAKLTNLKRLCLTFGMDVHPTQLSFSMMVNLKELKLYNVFGKYRTIGEELSVLTSLSELTLSALTLDVKGFAKALRKMVSLRDLALLECEFTEWCKITSEHMEYFRVNCKSGLVVLPYFPKLKKLAFSYCFEKEMDDTFEQICDTYPDLEELRFEAKSELKGKIHKSTSFSHISKLKFLKDLHLIGLDLDGIDWTKCSDAKVVNLQLKKCTIRVSEAQQLADSIGRGLRQFFLNFCKLRQPRMDEVDIKEKCMQDWRNRLPWCKVSFIDCELIDEVC